jgi:tetratricopeptide (TPR) repeat protein
MRALLLVQALVLVWTTAPAANAQRPVFISLESRATASAGTGDLVAEQAREAAEMGRWEQAAELYRSALLEYDGDPARWEALARALFESGRYRASVAAYQRAIQLDERRLADGALEIARAYALIGDAKQAARWTQLSVCDAGDSFRTPVRSSSAPSSGTQTCAHDRSSSSLHSCRRSPSSQRRCTGNPRSAIAPMPIA